MEIFNMSYDAQTDLLIADELRYCKKAIEKIADFQNKVIFSPKQEIIGDIVARYISPALYPLFMSILDVGKKNNKLVVLRCKTSNSRMTKLLSDHGVVSYYNNDEICTSNNNDNRVLFTDVKTGDGTSEIVGKIESLLPVNMSSQYRSRFTSKLYELFINSQKHSKTQVPAKASAYKDKNYFYISICDVGVGIPNNVKAFLKRYDIKDVDTMKWAFVDGHSAADNSTIISRGSGLGIIESFVKENRGKMFFVSGKALYHIHNNKTEYITLSKPIIGTFVTIRINVDKEHIYATPEEVKL